MWVIILINGAELQATVTRKWVLCCARVSFYVKFVLFSLGMNGKLVIWRVCLFSIKIFDFHQELLIHGRQSIQLLVAKPEFSGEVAKPVFVFMPVFINKVNSAIKALLYHNPSTAICFLIAKNLESSIIIRVNLIQTRGIEASVKQVETITALMRANEISQKNR